MRVVRRITEVIHGEAFELSYDLLVLEDIESLLSNFDEGSRIRQMFKYGRFQ